MINKNWMLILSILIYTVSFSQKTQIIVDQETQSPIEKVSIYYPESKTGTTTNDKGQFKFSATKINQKVVISAIGYSSILKPVSDLNKVDTIKMVPQETTLDELVLSETFHKDQRDAIINIQTIKLKDNAIKGAYNLTDELTQTPGVESKSTGTGISKPVIRGLSNNRLAIYIEGLRIENQQWGDDHSLGINANEVDQVEIVKGASSLMFGPDAIGGVLLFKDPKFADKNRVEFNYSPTYVSNSNGFVNEFNTKISLSNFSLIAGISKSNFDDYSDGRSVSAHNSQFDNFNTNFILGYTKGNYSGKIKWSYLNEKFGLLEHEDEHHEEEEEEHEEGEHPEDDDHDDHDDHEFEPYLRSQNYRLSTKHSLFYEKFNLNIDAGISKNRLKEFEEETPSVFMDLNTINYTISLKSKNDEGKVNWNIGTQGNIKENKNSGLETLIPNSTENEYGVFALSHIDLTRALLLEAGVRYDVKTLEADIIDRTVSKTFTNFNFSTGANYQVNEHFKLRASLSSGSRSPNSFELFTDGEHHGANRYEKGDENLNEEFAVQSDLSLIWSNDHWKFHFNPFFYHINNFIQINPSQEIIDGLQVFNFEQNDSRLFGIDAEISVQPNKDNQLSLGISNVKGENQNGDPLALMPSTKFNFQYQTSFKIKKADLKWRLNPTFNTAQNSLRSFETSTANYFLLNTSLQLNYKVNKTPIQMTVGVENIFDKYYFSHLSRYKANGFGNTGRSIIVNLKIPLKYEL